MIAFENMAGVAIIALGMVLTPSPNMIYLRSRTISQGRMAGMISLAGVAFGLLSSNFGIGDRGRGARLLERIKDCVNNLCGTNWRHFLF